MTKFFAVIAHDTPNAHTLRTEHLSAHLAHVIEHLETLAVAGPLHDSAGHVSGSLLVVKADSEDEARAFMALDPYYAAGVWATIEVQRFNAVAGDWVGGRAW
jgi:uncharacterized protein YciI